MTLHELHIHANVWCAKILRLMINCMVFMISIFKFLSQGDLTILYHFRMPHILYYMLPSQMVFSSSDAPIHSK